MDADRSNGKAAVKNLVTERKCNQALQTLKSQIAEIPTVQTWAKEAGVSRRWLCKSMKVVYGKPPKEILKKVKFEKVVWLICDEGLEAGCYSVAIDAGFKSSSGLSKFLAAHYDINFTDLKMEIITEEEHLNFMWLGKMPK